MRVNSYEKSAQNLILKTTKGQLKVEVWTDYILRIVYTQNESFSDKVSPMLTRKTPAPANWELVEDDHYLNLRTGALHLEIDKESCAFKYFDLRGNLLAKEPTGGGKELKRTVVKETIFSDDVQIKEEASADGLRTRVIGEDTFIERDAFQWKLAFEWAEDEAIYGLGSYEEGILNYRNHTQYMYQQNMRAVVPCFLSTKGYGILFDTYSLMVFRDDVHGSYLWSEVNDELDYYFIYGPEFDEIISGYRLLTGQVPMFPKWLFGYIQSKERYQSQGELKSVVAEYRKRQIPLDCIVLDWMSWEGNLWGQKSLDPARFPDPNKMIDDLHGLNARLMVSIWPHMSNDGPNHLEMKKHGYLLGNQSTYNAFNEGARKLYWQQTKEGLFSKGVDAWWCDCTEPFEADWQGAVKPEPEQRLIMNTEESKRYLDPQYINAYSLFHSQGLYEGQRSVTDEKRVVNLTRSAYAGQQRYGAITWSGDISATWATLKNQIADGLNFCMTGIPYWTFDIGGFFVHRREEQWFWNGDYNKGYEDLGYRELYVRWLQLGAFLPIFRSHGTDTPREVWRFGEPGSKFYDTIVKFINLRYRLLPYIYSLAWQVSDKDYTMLRALPYDFRHDQQVYNIKDQFMFGPSILVNPVTEPMYYGQDSKKLVGKTKSRIVYLPAGSIWYDFWTGQQYQGGQKIEARADLETMPLYIKGGSIIPMGPKVQYSSEKPTAPLELRIYPGADGTFELYDDEGDNYNYEKGHYRLQVITWDDSQRKLHFAAPVGKGYDKMHHDITFNIVLVDPERGIGLGETEKITKTLVYQGSEVELQF